MGALADLQRASELFEEGHRHLAVFAAHLVKQIGVTFDPIKRIVVSKDVAKWRKYGRWLASSESGSCPFDADAAGLEQVAERLYSIHIRFVISLRRVEADGDMFPIHYVHDRTPDWVQPRVAEETIPWSVLGHPFPCTFTRPRDVDDRIYSTFWSRGAGRDKPDWLFEKLPRLYEQLAAWRKWFADTRDRLEGRRPDVDFLFTDRQSKIMAALEGRALNAERLAKAIRCDRSVLWDPGGVKELKAAGLIVNDQKVGGYYRPDAPPTD